MSTASMDRSFFGTPYCPAIPYQLMLGLDVSVWGIPMATNIGGSTYYLMAGF